MLHIAVFGRIGAGFRIDHPAAVVPFRYRSWLAYRKRIIFIFQISIYIFPTDMEGAFFQILGRKVFRQLVVNHRVKKHTLVTTLFSVLDDVPVDEHDLLPHGFSRTVSGFLDGIPVIVRSRLIFLIEYLGVKLHLGIFPVNSPGVFGRLI